MLRHQLKKHLLFVVQRSAFTRASSCSGLHFMSSFHSSTSPNAIFMTKEKTKLRYDGKVNFRSFSSTTYTNIVVPSMGDSISEGTVVEWLKVPGDVVAEDEVIVVLETDKVSVDVRSSVAGILDQTLADVDATVLVGSALATIIPVEEKEATTHTRGSSGDLDLDLDSDSDSDSSRQENPIETVIVPSMGDSISEGTVVEWLKVPGDVVNADEVIVVLETDKVSVDVRSSVAGTLESILASVDQVVEIGTPLATIQPLAEGSPVPPMPTPAPPATVIEPSRITNNNNVVQSDVITTNDHRPVRREKMNRMRLRIAERLKESQNVAASLTTFQECDMTNLMALRKKYKDAFETKHGVKLGFMSAFIKASSEALLEVPAVNAELDEGTQELIFKDYVDMSVAVATPRGLVTPVLKDTHTLSLAEIELALSTLATRARKSEITVEEMIGGNFTISNGGVFGSLMGTPIINRPQSAILGMHATKMRAMVDPVTETIVARPMMYLALTYDHRIIDGREAVTCLKSIADKIQDPERLLLNL